MKNRRDWIVLGLLLIILFALESIAAQRYLTSVVPGANDFYSRWAGARALLLEGRDPYGLDVTAEIQPVIGIDPSEVGRGGFNYPLHVIFLFWPLVYLSYDWTQAIWLVTLQWLALGSVVGLLGAARKRPSPLGIVALLLAALVFYPITRSILLGQFTLWVLFFLAMMLWALDREHDGRAGILLAATSIKPQMVILIGPWLVLWAVGQRRWRFLGGLLGGGAAMLAASLALFPRWPLSFFEDIQRYDDFAGGRNPLQMALDFVWPNAPSLIFYVAVGLLVVLMALSWRRGWRADNIRFTRALHWTIVVGLLITFQTGTTNQVLLFIPLFAWIFAGLKRWGTAVTVTAVIIVWVGLWALFLGTISGDYENPILFLPLPFLSLLILILQEIWQRRQSAETHETLA
ncbi:MAG: DUF2029 domain-containing protein [Chloroflexi bacterium]|nr:DUF2029 domain-containing protein [Chloroflexota bacterium]